MMGGRAYFGLSNKVIFFIFVLGRPELEGGMQMIGGECATDVRYKPPPQGDRQRRPGESVGIEERTASESGFKPGASP